MYSNSGSRNPAPFFNLTVVYMQDIEAIFRKIAAEEFEKAIAPLVQKIAILERVLAKNGDRIDTTEAKRISGISDSRTLKKLFTPSQDGENGRLYWSRVEIETWNARKELTKTQPIKY